MGLAFSIESTRSVKYFSLGEFDYYAVLHTGTYNNPPIAGDVIDTLSIPGLNGAIQDIVLFYKGPDAQENITNAFNSIVLALNAPVGVLPPCSPVNIYSLPVQCSQIFIDPSTRNISVAMTLSSVNTAVPEGNLYPINFQSINATTVLSSDLTSNAFSFFVPDYFVQAQNDNKLNTAEWSYMPNFDLALHHQEEQKRKCRCNKKCCKCKTKPFTSPADLHSLLAKIYNIAHLVELGLLEPAEGEAQVLALWSSFEKYEVKDSENFKLIDVSGDNGVITMLVKYRISSAVMLVAMSITGTYLNGLYFNVSTIPITGDDSSNAKHSFNKAIAQFVPIR